MGHKTKRRNRNPNRQRVLRQVSKLLAQVPEGTRLKIARLQRARARRVVMARESRHLLFLEKLYREGLRNEREKRQIIAPSDVRAEHFRLAGKALLARVEQ